MEDTTRGYGLARLPLRASSHNAPHLHLRSHLREVSSERGGTVDRLKYLVFNTEVYRDHHLVAVDDNAVL
jgi:hypothetical protein